MDRIAQAGFMSSPEAREAAANLIALGRLVIDRDLRGGFVALKSARHTYKVTQAGRLLVFNPGSGKPIVVSRPGGSCEIESGPEDSAHMLQGGWAMVRAGRGEIVGSVNTRDLILSLTADGRLRIFCKRSNAQTYLAISKPEGSLELCPKFQAPGAALQYGALAFVRTEHATS